MLRRVGFRRVPTAAYSDFGKLIVLTNYRDANNLSKLDMRKLIQFAGFESVEPMALSAKRQVFVLTFVEGV